MTPPLDHPAVPRRFEGSSPNAAVRWAYDQAMAPRPSLTLGGVAALVALATAAGASGVVVEGTDGAGNALVLPDAELLQLCGEIAGCKRIMEAAREGNPCPWDQLDAFQAATARISEASRTRERLIPRALELPATTQAGTLAKAQMVLGLFGDSGGRRAAAVRSLVADLDKALGRGGIG